MNSLKIINNKKDTLEESLFIISSILRSNCDGWASLGCSTTAKFAGLGDIYSLLIDSLALPDIVTTKIKDGKEIRYTITKGADKLEYISDCYKNNINLQHIIDIAKRGFNDKVMYNFIKLIIPLGERIMTLTEKDKMSYVEFQSFKDEFYRIKEGYAKLTIGGGKSKKYKKKKDSKKKKNN